jgi:hypothetical protein
MIKFKLAACFALTLTLAACAITDARRHQARADLARDIADEAISYNEAYSAAISGQILLNILRAYNRQPRQYMSMSGFSNDTPDSRQTSFSVNGLPLGELGEEWGQGALSNQRVTRDEPVYTVTPFAQDAFSRIARQATSPEVFRHYWETGWNRDLLLFLMVERMDVVSGEQSAVLYNNPGTIAADCQGEGYDSGGCAFVRATREFIQRTSREPASVAAAGLCAPLATYGARAPAPMPEGSCPVRIVVDGDEYRLALRSLDGMIYYVGEILRRDDAHPPSADAFAEARLRVRGAGSRDELTPLFRIVPANSDTERAYAATVSFGGQRYSAGAPADGFCYRPDAPDACRGRAGDRSGTVLEFLVGILAFNQSEASVRPPQNTVIR